MTKPCEYCGHQLPTAVDRRSRRIRTMHFHTCPKRTQAAEPPPEPGDPTRDQVDAFIRGAGYNHGFLSMESWARRMAEHGAREIARLEHNVGVLTSALWKACGDDEAAVNATIESQGGLL